MDTFFGDCEENGAFEQLIDPSDSLKRDVCMCARSSPQMGLIWLER